MYHVKSMRPAPTMTTPDEILEECREMLRDGAQLENVLGLLRKRGLSKVESAKALIGLQQADIRAAKEIVHYSATWANVRERDEEFQRSLE
jgi:hypothetical protein